jgi:hypothetical protein
MRFWWRLFASMALVIVGLLLTNSSANAVPAFASQTGEPCTSCHIGAFGPQLTPLGRAFKIGGYTQRGGEGWQSYVPLAAMIQTSFTNTGSGVPPDQVTHHYNSNNNFALDQISVFLAGGIGEHTGGFAQFTYSDVSNASSLDNTDLRPYTTTFDLFGDEMRVGTTVNNNPTVQDPYNSSFAWGYPYITSKLARCRRLRQSWPADSTTTPSATRSMHGTIAACIWRQALTRRWGRGCSAALGPTSAWAVLRGQCPMCELRMNGAGTSRHCI